MGFSVFPEPSASGKTMYRRTLTSGTSWTVPTGVTYVNVTLYGGGGGGGSYSGGNNGSAGGSGGTTTFTGATSAAGGAGGQPNNDYGGAANNGVSGSISRGGTTGYKNDTYASPPYGRGIEGNIISSTLSTTPGASISYTIGAGGTGAASGNNQGTGGAGGSGKIDIEYWV